MWNRAAIPGSLRLVRARIGPLTALPFPRMCAVCGGSVTRSAAIWCDACSVSSGFIESPFCTHCRKHRTFNSTPCPDCGSAENPSAVLSLGVFDRAWRAIVHAVKYRGERRLAVALGRVMAERIPESHDAELVVPVPTSPQKRRERGFGHAETIADSLAASLNLRSQPNALRLRRGIRDQTRLRGADRLRNLQGALSLATPEVVAERRVLVIDDVMTTGATLREAGRALTEAGAASVLASVVCVNLGILPETDF